MIRHLQFATGIPGSINRPISFNHFCDSNLSTPIWHWITKYRQGEVTRRPREVTCQCYRVCTRRCRCRQLSEWSNSDVTSQASYDGQGHSLDSILKKSCLLPCLASINVALVTNNYIGCSFKSIDSMFVSPVPEILYYNPTWCFVDFVVFSLTNGRGFTVNYHTAYTHLHLNGPNVSKT